MLLMLCGRPEGACCHLPAGHAAGVAPQRWRWRRRGHCWRTSRSARPGGWHRRCSTRRRSGGGCAMRCWSACRLPGRGLAGLRCPPCCRSRSLATQHLPAPPPLTRSAMLLLQHQRGCGLFLCAQVAAAVPHAPAGWNPDTSACSPGMPEVLLGVVASDVRLAVRSLRDYCQALGLPFKVGRGGCAVCMYLLFVFCSLVQEPFFLFFFTGG